MSDQRTQEGDARSAIALGCGIDARKIPITVILGVKNEALNLARCLRSLGPVRRVIVVDSHSVDGTDRIASDFDAEVVQFVYKGGYPKKRQWALSTLDITTEWVLLLDADEVVPPELWAEIDSAISLPDAPSAFAIKKGFHFLGRRFRVGGFSHKAVILFKTGTARFERIHVAPGESLDMEVHERVIVNGSIRSLRFPLIHEDFKGLEAYIDRHNKYSTWEANLRYAFIKNRVYGEEQIAAKLFGDIQERRRFLKQLVMRMPFEQWFWFVYHYVLCLGFLEGRAGFVACQIRRQYIEQVHAKLFELSIAGRD